MSDSFSWAPFGPSRDDDEGDPLPPLPPLAPFGQEEGQSVSEMASPPIGLPTPEPEPEPVLFDTTPETLSAPPPEPATPPISPWHAAPPPGGITPDKRPRPQIKGGGDPAASLIWGIMGLTICPILIPSIAAVRIGYRARQAGGGLQQRNPGLATWGITLGWIGIILWTLFIALMILGFAIDSD